MVEACESASLELEALDERVVFDKAWHQSFESNLATQRLLHRAIHNCHPAGAESFQHVVVAEPRSGQVLHARDKDRREPVPTRPTLLSRVSIYARGPDLAENVYRRLQSGPAR